MSRYIFSAKSSTATLVEGTVEAESEIDAINKISVRGFFPLSLDKDETAVSDSLAVIKKKDVVVFTRSMANLIGAGISVLSSLTLVRNETVNTRLRSVLDTIITDIKGGKTFSDSLSRYPRLFDGIYCSMIKTGEASGNLKELLQGLASFMEQEDEFFQDITSALIYPLFVVAVSILTVILLLAFVVPKLTTMFIDMGQALPLPTRLLIGLSSTIVSWGWLALVIIAGVGLSLKHLLGFAHYKTRFDRMVISVWIIGDLVFKTEISRLLKSLSILLSSGVLITNALDRACGVISNSYLRGKLSIVPDRLREGERLTHALRSLTVFPETMLNIIAIGEETGSLEQSLRHISGEYEKEVSRALKMFVRILEPAVIVIIGAIVAFIVVGMLLPVMEINLLVK